MKKQEQIERQKVIEEAKTWIGTPYHPNARIKGSGVDCGQILIGVYHAALPKKIPDIDPGPYSISFALHHSEEKYKEWIEKYAHKVTRKPLPGDIILFKFGQCRSHSAIVIEWPQVIHSYIKQGVIKGDATKKPLGLHLEYDIYSVW